VYVRVALEASLSSSHQNFGERLLTRSVSSIGGVLQRDLILIVSCIWNRSHRLGSFHIQWPL